jgi:hypothetical protein
MRNSDIRLPGGRQVTIWTWSNAESRPQGLERLYLN